MNEDLKWLAENVHEWLDDHCAIQRDNFHATHEFLYGSNTGNYQGVGEVCFTRSQWQAARDELSGKPSWDDAPEWAEWLAQDSYGDWEWFAENPSVDTGIWASSAVESFANSGQLLGDWRNTLERRPMSVKQAFEKMRQIGGFDVEKSLAYTNCDAPTEWRGPEDGLPPVGIECEYTTARGEPFEPCIFIGFVRGECYVLRHMDSPTSVDRFMSNDPYRFRKLRTEEDKAVEEMVAIRKAHHWTDEEFCRELYARGYRKQESK